MPKPKNSAVYKFFKFNIDCGKYICLINDCGANISAHAKHMERHIESLHYLVYVEHFLHRKEKTTAAIELKRSLDNENTMSSKVKINYFNTHKSQY